MEYGQFCPISKAMEILGEKWTLLVVRELLMGGSRFNELQRGLSLISPTMLSKRLDTLEQHGLIIKKKIPGQKGYEYFPTESCLQLLPIIRSIGEWGMRWTRANLTDQDYDVELLMLYLKRSIITDKLVGRETVLHFQFTDIEQSSDWWVLIKDDDVELCDKDIGKEIDVYFTSTVKQMSKMLLGEISYRQGIADGLLTVVGHPSLTRNLSNWLSASVFSDLPKMSDL